MVLFFHNSLDYTTIHLYSSSQKRRAKPAKERKMKLIKEFQTAYLKISLLALTKLYTEGAFYYIRETGLTATNEHESMQTFNTREEAEAEYQRLQELLRDNGNAIMETHYVNECPIVW